MDNVQINIEWEIALEECWEFNREYVHILFAGNELHYWAGDRWIKS